MASSYQELKKQIADLQSRIAVAKAEERETTLAQIRQHVSEFDFTESEIFGRKRSAGKSAKVKGSVSPVKYMDPKTGATWTGRGRAPGWISEAKNRDRYLVASE